jgi:low temperature requirement protein LtrA
VDWILEGVALAALLSAVALVIVYFPQIPERFVNLGYRYGRPQGVAGLMTARNVLWMVAGIDLAAYVGLTVGARGKGLFEIPPELERQSPHLRQMLFSMVIVMKTVLMLFAVYLVWSLVNVGLRRGGGLNGGFLTLFTLLVPVPLVFYTVKMRKYSK